MSTNKSKFFEVITISSVRANNQADAMKIAMSRTSTNRSVPDAEVLGRTTNVERLPASDARNLAETLNINAN
jgi:hypothetical protein